MSTHSQHCPDPCEHDRDDGRLPEGCYSNDEVCDALADVFGEDPRSAKVLDLLEAIR